MNYADTYRMLKIVLYTGKYTKKCYYLNTLFTFVSFSMTTVFFFSFDSCPFDNLS